MHNCGFEGGVNALITMGALEMGLTEEELPDIVRLWREASPNIKAGWKALNNAARVAVKFPGKVVGCLSDRVRFKSTGGWLWLKLPSGRRLLIQGSAGFRPGALDGRQADVVYLGVGQLGVQPTDYIERYWAQTVRAVRARRVVLIHWDDFFRPLTAPLRALPYAGDDLDVSMRVLGRLAEADGVAMHLPQLWQRCDPWV